MKRKKLLEDIFDKFPEEKEKYEKMNKFEKGMYKIGLNILEFRNIYRENIIPKLNFY
jgi:hypothetical protein